MKKNLVYVLISIVIVIALYFHYGIYKYDKLDQKTPVRINRFTGQTWLLNDEGVWLNKKDIAAQAKAAADKAEQQTRLIKEQEIKAKDVPLVVLSSKKENFKPTGSKYDSIRGSILLTLDQDHTSYIDNPIQLMVVTWENWSKDSMVVTVNDSEVTDVDLGKENFIYSVTFHDGKNNVSVKTSTATYSYDVILN